MPPAKFEKHVSWACPLETSPKVVHRELPGNKSRKPTFISSSHSAQDSLHDILLRHYSNLPSEQAQDRRDSVMMNSRLNTSFSPDANPQPCPEDEEARASYAQHDARERSTYERRHLEREQKILTHDALFADPNAQKNYCWMAMCKSTHGLKRYYESKPDDYFLSQNEVFVTLFINRNLTYVRAEETTLTLVLTPLLIQAFPNASGFRFAIFFPREEVEAGIPIPDCLRYIFGSLKATRRTVSLEGATTEMETKFVNLQHYGMRRFRFDHVQVQMDSLEQEIMVAKVDHGPANMQLPRVRQISGFQARQGAAKPINIKWPKSEDKINKVWLPNVKKKRGFWP